MSPSNLRSGDLFTVRGVKTCYLFIRANATQGDAKDVVIILEHVGGTPSALNWTLGSPERFTQEWWDKVVVVGNIADVLKNINRLLDFKL